MIYSEWTESEVCEIMHITKATYGSFTVTTSVFVFLVTSSRLDTHFSKRWKRRLSFTHLWQLTALRTIHPHPIFHFVIINTWRRRPRWPCDAEKKKKKRTKKKHASCNHGNHPHRSFSFPTWHERGRRNTNTVMDTKCPRSNHTETLHRIIWRLQLARSLHLKSTLNKVFVMRISMFFTPVCTKKGVSVCHTEIRQFVLSATAVCKKEEPLALWGFWWIRFHLVFNS